MKCSQINRYNEIQIIREMRSPWQLIMWKRKQFNKGQTRFENRLGRGVAVKRGEESRGEREGGWWRSVCGCSGCSIACFPRRVKDLCLSQGHRNN